MLISRLYFFPLQVDAVVTIRSLLPGETMKFGEHRELRPISAELRQQALGKFLQTVRNLSRRKELPWHRAVAGAGRDTNTTLVWGTPTTDQHAVVPLESKDASEDKLFETSSSSSSSSSSSEEGSDEV